MSDDERKAEVARQMATIETHGETAKIEISFKHGKLVAATLIKPLLT